MRVPDDAISHLRAADPVMAGLIDRIGPLEYSVEPDLWRSVTGSIVGQQLSVAAARTIRARFAALGVDGYPTPQAVLALEDEPLRACGLSRAKLRYVRAAAEAWLDGTIDPREFIELDDERVIEQLVKIKGIGRWTAEMVLLFSLDRPDVFACDDLGLRNAVQRWYGLEERPGRSELERISAVWRPYRSHASRYLWRSLTK